MAIAGVVWRRRRVRRLLADRQSRALVPSDELDPQVDAVLRFAAQLGRVRRRGRGRLERPASAVRVRIASKPGGRLAYELHHPQPGPPGRRHGVSAYPGIDIYDLDVPRGEQPPAGDCEARS